MKLLLIKLYLLLTYSRRIATKEMQLLNLWIDEGRYNHLPPGAYVNTGFKPLWREGERLYGKAVGGYPFTYEDWLDVEIFKAQRLAGDKK